MFTRTFRRLRDQSSALLARPAEPAPAPEGSVRTAPDQHESSYLEARLLGSFELTVDGREVRNWHGRRGLDILKFVLASPKRSRPRDQLLDQFWPGIDPDRARNRLHVAVSSVRRAVLAEADVNILEHRDGFYQVPEEVDLRIDVDQFEVLIEEARAHEVDGRPDLCTASFAEAAALYRDDFLADDPYAEWALVTREALRMAYLDVLDRLAAAYWSAEAIGDCINIAQRILGHDCCREDAHRLLMRSAARHGRTSEVVRQYEICRQVLAKKLGTSPSAATTRLYVELVDGSNR